jgi:hypothetical protein
MHSVPQIEANRVPDAFVANRMRDSLALLQELSGTNGYISSEKAVKRRNRLAIREPVS